MMKRKFTSEKARTLISQNYRHNYKTLVILLVLLAPIFSFNSAYSQLTYSDIIPDAELTNYDSIYIDINKDGTNDFTLFHKHDYGSQFYPYHFTITPTNGSEVAIINDSASAIMKGEMIDHSLNWNIHKTFIEYIQIASPSGDHYYGHWTNIREGYLGLRLTIDNEYHYAWLRLNYNNYDKMWAVDYAFNEMPENDIAAGEELPDFASSVFAKDEYDYFDGRDIIVSFTKAAEESLYTEYRIIIAKANDETAEDVSIMSQLSEDKYYPVLVDLDDNSFTETINLLESTVDKDGDFIEKFADYKVYVLNISESGNPANNKLSVASGIFSLHGHIVAVDKPIAYDDGNDYNSSDIKISFNTNIAQDFITEFRAFIIPTEDIAGFDAQTAWSLSSDYYTSIPIDEDTMATFYLNENQKDINGNFISENTSIHIAILSVPDSINSRNSVLSIPSRKFILTEPNELLAGQKEGNYIHWFECDTEFAPYPYWNGTNPNHGNEEFNIDMNRDGLEDFKVYGSSYSSSGGSVGRTFLLTPLRENKVLICDHAEHENWIDVLQEKHAIGEAYRWHDSISILKSYSFGGNSGILRNDGHLGSIYNTVDYYIGFMLMDNGYPQYAWLKMNGVWFLEYAFSDIYNGTNYFNKEKTFSVFPNPANDFIQIESTSLAPINNISVNIINSLGLTIDKYSLEQGSHIKNINHYPTGLYFVVIMEGTVVLETHRVIVQ